MSRAIVLHADRRVSVLQPVTLEHYQEIVGGYIECIAIPAGHDRVAAQMVVNEEGLLKGLPRNGLAEMLLSKCRGPISQPIVGDVCVVSLAGDGDFGDAPPWVEEWAEKATAGGAA